jgi:hypothetical protein
VDNGYPDMLSFATTNEGATTSASGGYRLVINNDGNGANLEVHFHAHFDNTQSPPFGVDAQLTLNVGNLISFSVGPDTGYIATMSDGIVDFNGTFSTSTDGGSDVDYDNTFSMTDGALDVNYNSSLESYVTDGFMPPGETTDASHFQWSLTLTLS